MSRPLPIELEAADDPPLGMSPARFLREYWQKRPLLVRGAFPGFVAPITADELAGLACEPGALGRLVHHDRRRDRYRVEHGPFAESRLAALPRRDWTLLVQDVDKWDADVRALLGYFDFLPRWRIDDVMVSVAAPGGSVGAHLDQYDVFLLQGAGRRRWRIDDRAGAPTASRDDGELCLLKRFTPNREWRLEPGDLLYLPPGVPHHGVAGTGNGAHDALCMTFSFGMRAPAQAELLLDLAQSLAEALPETARYADPDLDVPTDPAEIDAAALSRLRRSVPLAADLDQATLRDWFGRFITRYRSAGEPPAPRRPPSLQVIESVLAAGGTLDTHPHARLAWSRAGRGARLYACGEAFALPLTAARRLADEGPLNRTAWRALGGAGRTVTIELVRSGIRRLRRPTPPRRGT